MMDRWIDGWMENGWMSKQWDRDDLNKSDDLVNCINWMLRLIS